jgi:hypothetical protein
MRGINIMAVAVHTFYILNIQRYTQGVKKCRTQVYLIYASHAAISTI